MTNEDDDSLTDRVKEGFKNFGNNIKGFTKNSKNIVPAMALVTALSFGNIDSAKAQSPENKNNTIFQPQIELSSSFNGVYGSGTLGFGNNDFLVGPFVSYGIPFSNKNWKKENDESNSIREEKQIDVDRDDEGNKIFRYSVTTGDVNKTLQYQNLNQKNNSINWIYGIALDKKISNNFSFSGKIGLTNRLVRERYEGNINSTIEKRDSEGEVIDSRELSVGEDEGDNYIKNFGKEKALYFSSGLNWFPGKNQNLGLGANIGVYKGLGDKLKSSNFSGKINLKYYFNR